MLCWRSSSTWVFSSLNVLKCVWHWEDHLRFLFLPRANPLCVLQLFRSVEKPEGAHGSWEWVSPQGAASAQCHPCQSTERPRQHRQACHQHKQDRGRDVRGWWWVIRNTSPLFQMQCFFILLFTLWYNFSLVTRTYIQHACWLVRTDATNHVHVSSVNESWCTCLFIFQQIGERTNLRGPQSQWTKPTVQRPKWPPATETVLSTGWYIRKMKQ